MSRKYLNDKYCVRCGRHNETPYLRKNVKLLDNDGRAFPLHVTDIGCGNGRNSEFMRKRNHYVYSYDMVDDYGDELTLGKDEIPLHDKSMDIVLCNYSLMFLNKKERKQVIREIKRIAADGCFTMVELYDAKDSFAKNKEEMLEMQKEIFDAFDWEKIRYSQGRFIVKKPKEK